VRLNCTNAAPDLPRSAEGAIFAVRKATLERVLARATSGIRFNEHLDEEDGPLVFEHACKLGLEGIVSKRRDSAYSSGRSPDWIKSKNPNAPAVQSSLPRDQRRTAVIAHEMQKARRLPRQRGNWRFGPACLRLMFADAGPGRRGNTEARPGDESPPHFSYWPGIAP
jgi:hypothetical protein